MADISGEISAFQNAVYGEEVRGSMISLAEKLNDEVEDATGTVAAYEAGYDAAMEAAAGATDAATNAASSATSAASSATSAAASANSAASNATSKANAAQALSDSINAAETARASAETSRRSAETSRANAEAARVTAETARAGSEANRQSAELTRQESETARNSAELSRVSAEATRGANETQRQSNESTRQSAESNRSTIFTQMQNAFADMQQQTLPPATTSTLGGIIVGEGLSVAADGTLSFEAGDFLTEDEAEATYATITSVEGKADAVHYHAASDITSGTLGVARGGTGVTTAAAERERLGLGSTTDALPIANGGTGATTASGALAAILGGDPLGVTDGGTGVETAAEERDRLGLGSTTGPVPIASGGTGSTTAADALTALGAAAADEYLPLTAGSTAPLTDSLYIVGESDAKTVNVQSPSMDVGEAISALTYIRSTQVLDKNGEIIGHDEFLQQTDGTIGHHFAGVRQKINGTNTWRQCTMSVSPSGTVQYSIYDPPAFCTALNVGNKTEAYRSSALSVGNSSWVNITSLSLVAGMWVVMGTVQYANNGSGIRISVISKNSSGAASDAERRFGSQQAAAAAANFPSYLTCMSIMDLSSTTTVYLKGYQSSGSALDAYGSINAVRIK